MQTGIQCTKNKLKIFDAAIYSMLESANLKFINPILNWPAKTGPFLKAASHSITRITEKFNFYY